MFNSKFQQINTLGDLNAALLGIKPSVSGLSLSMLETKGATLSMLDRVISQDPTRIVDGTKRATILHALKTPLAAAVNTAPLTFTYDTHGDKHFPGGPAGTKFANDDLRDPVVKATINAALVAILTPLVGRIRRNANGANQTYYYTSLATTFSARMPLVIQVDYVYGFSDSIGYHGYPDSSVTRFGLSRTKGGPAIPL